MEQTLVPTSNPSAQSHTYRLVEAQLRAARPALADYDHPLMDFIMARRTLSAELLVVVPFHRIARELVEITEVEITHEAVRRWYRSAQEDTTTAAAA
jgi:formyltetrahydrofolate hydrolase